MDQFEEVFTLCRDRAERDRFIDLLLTARSPDSRLRVLLAVRADFYARCAEHRDLADTLSRSGLLLGPMAAAELREAVVRPAQAAGLIVERELTARIVDDVLDRPGALPMLSHALLETWRRRKGRLLTLAAYEASGGVSGAIAATAEAVYGELSPDRSETTRHLLLRMVEPGQGTADTRRPLSTADLNEWADPQAPAVVERLARARLVTVDEDGVQLAHEALLTAWPRLHGWIEADRERLRLQRRLAEATSAWLEQDRCPGALYRGANLARAEELFPDPAQDPGLTTTERAFLLAALDARAAESRAAARTTRRTRMLTVALSAVLAVALVVAAAVWRERTDNERQRVADAARRVAETADSLRGTEPRTALLLGVGAWRTARLPETRGALLGSLYQPESDAFTDPAPGDGPARLLTGSGRTLLSADRATWRTWDVSTHRRAGHGRLPAGSLVEAATSDARIVAVTTERGLRLWDTGAERWTGAPRPVPYATAVAFAADGRTYLVSAGDQVVLRGVADGGVRFAHRDTSLTDPAVSADGSLIALCPAEGKGPQVWDAARRRPVHGGWERTRAACVDGSGQLSLGPGDRLITSTPAEAIVWDSRTGDRIARVHDPGLIHASLSDDGTFLATADRAEVRVWRVSDPQAPVFRHSLDNQRLDAGPTWDPGGTKVRYMEGGTVHTLDLGEAVTHAWHRTPFDTVALSPDGRTYATAQRFGRRYVFRLHSTTGDRRARILPPLSVPRDPALPVVPQDTSALIAFSPDGRELAYGVTAPGRSAVAQPVQVWDVRRDRAVTTLDLPGAAPAGAALGPLGRTLYVARSGGAGLTGEVWDTATHRRTATLPGLTGPHLTVRPDGRLLALDDRAVSLPSARSTAVDLARGGEPGALAFSPDGSLFAAGDLTGRVTFWDGRLRHRAGVLRSVFPPPLGDTAEAVSALAASPDGRTLAVGGDSGTLQLWDTTTRQPLGGPLTTSGDVLTSLAFSSDGTTLYAASPHAPLQRYTVDPTEAIGTVCRRAGTDLTAEQWREYGPGFGPRRVCSRPG
ncbi:WD40 repeat domain-containing protein [Streptomyces griseorubiginosus]|uniref:WD40 repeat domain-containing protein n=1 Tax=Streptomyces griseorubiginosus TaxID=67304 RepID=UPI0033B4E771